MRAYPPAGAALNQSVERFLLQPLFNQDGILGFCDDLVQQHNASIGDVRSSIALELAFGGQEATKLRRRQEVRRFRDLVLVLCADEGAVVPGNNSDAAWDDVFECGQAPPWELTRRGVLGGWRGAAVALDESLAPPLEEYIDTLLAKEEFERLRLGQWLRDIEMNTYVVLLAERNARLVDNSLSPQ